MLPGPSSSTAPEEGAVGQKEKGQIYCHNVPEPEYLSREKVLKKNQLLLLFPCLLSVPEAIRNKPESLDDAVCRDQP